MDLNVIDWSLNQWYPLKRAPKQPTTYLTNNIYTGFLVSLFLGRFFHLCSAMLESAGVEYFSSELLTNNSVFTIPGI